MKSLHSFMMIPNDILFILLLQYFKKLVMSVSVRENKFRTVTSAKDSYQIPKKSDMCR